MYEIKPGIPIPKPSRPGRRGKSDIRDALLSADLGDSFFVSTAEERDLARVSASWHGLRIVVRMWFENGERGYRIWVTGDK